MFCYFLIFLSEFICHFLLLEINRSYLEQGLVRQGYINGVCLSLLILKAEGDVLFGAKDPDKKQASVNRSPHLQINYLKPTHW